MKQRLDGEQHYCLGVLAEGRAVFEMFYDECLT